MGNTGESSERQSGSTNNNGKELESFAIFGQKQVDKASGSGLERNGLSYGSVNVSTADWEWPLSLTKQQHTERITLLRPIPFEIPAYPEKEQFRSEQRRALSLNISSGGILLLTDLALELQQVVKILVPSASNLARTPTLAEVRWIRPVPFALRDQAHQDQLYFVGLKFVL